MVVNKWERMGKECMESPMLKYCKALVNLAVVAVLAVLVIFLVPRLLLFFMPFLVGWLIASMASPLVQFFEKKVKIKRKTGSAMVIIVVIGLVVLVIYLIGSKLVEELIDFVGELPYLWKQMESELQEVGQNLDILYERFPTDVQGTLQKIWEEFSASIGGIIGNLGSPTITAVGNFAKKLPSIIIGSIMALLFAYFYVAERAQVYSWMGKTLPKSMQKNFRLLRKSLGKAVGGYFKAQFKIEIWMYILLVIGLTILQVQYALLIALGIAILDFIPFFGTGTVMVPWAIIELLGADYKMTIGLLIIWGGGQLARQIIQPKIVGDSIGVPPIPTLLLLFIGYKLGGVIGMIVAVPLGLILYTMYEEGMFETTKTSILILTTGINQFRKFRKTDIEILEKERKE
jgi:sporulation integral membrane protein YtvI